MLRYLLFYINLGDFAKKVGNVITDILVRLETVEKFGIIDVLDAVIAAKFSKFVQKALV